MVFIPKRVLERQVDPIRVDWFKEQPKEKLRISRNKPTLVQRIRKPDQDLANLAKLKMAETPKNKVTEVVELKDRIIFENKDPNKAPKANEIPDLMTAAKLRDAEASNLEHLVTKSGEFGGRGKVTGRDRMKGQRNGIDLVDSLGNSTDGLLEGGGNPGIADPLDIIDFLSDLEGPQRVAFCLDISASMQVPIFVDDKSAVSKIKLATNSLKDALLALDDDDEFNLITFSSRTTQMEREMIPSSMEKVMDAMTYLDRFTPTKIQDNVGTNLLAAIEKGLDLGASVVVVVTDGLPTSSKNKSQYIETDPSKILQTVKKKNGNQSSIFLVGLEIDLKHTPHAKWLLDLAQQNRGRTKFIQAGDTQQTAERKNNYPSIDDNTSVN